jgi:hypothetical protein
MQQTRCAVACYCPHPRQVSLTIRAAAADFESQGLRGWT